MALLLALAVCLGVLAALTKGLEEVVTFLRELLEWGGLSAELFVPLLKRWALLSSAVPAAHCAGTRGRALWRDWWKWRAPSPPFWWRFPCSGRHGRCWRGCCEKRVDNRCYWGVYPGFYVPFLHGQRAGKCGGACHLMPVTCWSSWTMTLPTAGTLSAGAAKLWNKAWTLLTAEVRSSVRVMVVLLGAVLLYGVAEGSFQAAGHPLMAISRPAGLCAGHYP